MSSFAAEFHGEHHGTAHGEQRSPATDASSIADLIVNSVAEPYDPSTSTLSFRAIPGIPGRAFYRPPSSIGTLSHLL